MNICVFGSTGMVGRNLVNALVELETHNVLTPSRLEVNLLDYSAVFEYLKTHSPDLVIHCAGIVGGIQANIENPVKFLTENTTLGNNVILGAKEAGVTQLINLSSSCVYPRNAKNPLSEEQILTGELEPTNEGYALAKIYAMRLCEYIGREDPRFLYKTIIPPNLYGPFDNFHPKKAHMIPAVIRKIHEAKELGANQVEIWGDGTARREFMFVGDLANFLVGHLDNLKSLPLVMNVGLGYDYSINEYYETIGKIIGFYGSFKHNLNKPVGMKQKLVNIQKLANTGWKAQSTLENGIEKTYKYFLEIKDE